MRIKRIQATVIAGLLLLMLVLPQLALAADPEITDVHVYATATTATIMWNTYDYPSDSRVNYGLTTALAQTKYDSDDVINHNILLTGLESGKVYFYKVKSNGLESPVPSGEFYSFKTLLGWDISLDPDSGSYGDLIEVTASVMEDGTYHICWDSLTNVEETFTAATEGSYTVKIFVPEDTQGEHTVYLVTDNYREKADAVFEIGPSVEIEETDPEDIDPMVGPVDTEVTVRCYGFEATQDIRLKFEDVVVKTGTTDTYGSWTVSSYLIPPTPGGGSTFEVEAKEDGDWVLRRLMHFRVTPEISAPGFGTVGHAVKVTGTGFDSEEEGIEIIFKRQLTDVEVVVQPSIPPVADQSGSWEATVVIPSIQSGSYTIDASGESTRARDVPDIEFFVGAGILVDPISAPVGYTITVSGGGFAPGETGIEVTFDGEVEKRGITAKQDGTWDTSFDLPTSTYGPHTVSASGDITNSLEVEGATLGTEAKIEEPSPDEGAPGASVSLTGSGFRSNQNLTVTVGGAEASEDLRSLPNGNVVISFRVPKGSTEGKRELVVTDGEATNENKVYFTVKEKVLATPQPISPKKDDTLRSGQITFRWGAITAGSAVTYMLEISKTPDFTSIYRSKPSIEESSYPLIEGEELGKGVYYWRVKAEDNYGNLSPWSDSVKFTVSPIPIWVWVVVGLVVLVGLMVVAYRETKFRVTE